MDVIEQHVHQITHTSFVHRPGQIGTMLVHRLRQGQTKDCNKPWTAEFKSWEPSLHSSSKRHRKKGYPSRKSCRKRRLKIVIPAQLIESSHSSFANTLHSPTITLSTVNWGLVVSPLARMIFQTHHKTWKCTSNSNVLAHFYAHSVNFFHRRSPSDKLRRL